MFEGSRGWTVVGLEVKRGLVLLVIETMRSMLLGELLMQLKVYGGKAYRRTLIRKCLLLQKLVMPPRKLTIRSNPLTW